MGNTEVRDTGLMWLKILTVVVYFTMITVNTLANLLPINGITTGQVSESYPNLFTPAGYAFSIWGLIYILLAVFVIYFVGAAGRTNPDDDPDWLQLIALWFCASCLANSAWIMAWHFRLIAASVACMAVILYCLAAISLTTAKMDPDHRTALFVRLPFSIYFGWITVAAIANITVLLVSLGWNGGGVAPEAWTVLVLLAGVAIGAATIIKQRDVAYGLVIIWAYAAILYKHVSAGGFAGAYPSVIGAAAVCIGLLLAAIVYAAWKPRLMAAQQKTASS